MSDLNEREHIFREIAEALLDDTMPDGSCHGCSNIGADALHWLKQRFPGDLSFVETSEGRWDREAWLKEDEA